MLADPSNVVLPEDEPKLFEQEYRSCLYKYLENHSLRETNQDLLFRYNSLLAYYISRWSLAVKPEAKLFEFEWRVFLLPYFERGSLVAKENELLLFSEYAMKKLRRFYLAKYNLYNEEAEKCLFEEEYVVDIQIYVENKHILFKEYIPLLKEKYPDLYDVYISYHPDSETKTSPKA